MHTAATSVISPIAPEPTPDLIAQDQVRHAAVLSAPDADLGRVRRTRRTSSDEPDALDDRGIQLQHDRLAQAMAFDARYPDPEALLRDTMNQNETSPARAHAQPPHPRHADPEALFKGCMSQNETSGASSPAPAKAPTTPEPLLRAQMRQNETSSAPSQATAMAVTAALAGLGDGIRAAVR